ncbi:TIGR02391 family protein [Gordonia sp. L191]|uniref:TIGR02391 family protein n=1 Tax=Gordonia sp. L191 TaxID=2982699 RepID=UPI0024C08479|nr:TIGR02391 family protein [Gordonia sp. L191]WHU48657.1 TIGR02391 family protein [Gordonia sp. L191]
MSGDDAAGRNTGAPQGLDSEWAVEQCNEWLRLHERVAIPEAEREPRGAKQRLKGSTAERAKITNRVLRVAEAVWADWNDRYFRNMNATTVRELIFELEEGIEVRERLGLSHSGPALAADALHPWVWEAARPHWNADNYDAAVWAAAINVNSQLKAKAKRPDLGESNLVEAAFGISPPDEGKVRLRLCDETNPALFKDRHLGALSLGRGLFAGVRNPLNHIGAEDLTEQEALETLAAWSLFARWVDRADVVTNEATA